MNVVVAALAIASVLAQVGCASAASDTQCGPFGDPPAEIQTGFVARHLATVVPACYRGGKVVGPWRDSAGTNHYSCLYQPASASPSKPLPLIVFLHGSIANADSVVLTNLLDFLSTANLGAPGRGFILLAPQGRDTTHKYPSPDDEGLGWDNWYRQLNPTGDVTVAGVTYKENVDAAAIDHFIDEQVATGKVDRKRIFLTGWSNGAAMAILYSLNRPQVASAAVYSAPDPFGAFQDPCEQKPVINAPASNGEIQVFNPHVPLMHVRNSCDIGGICPNGLTLDAQVRAIGGAIDDVIIDSDSNQVQSCEAVCGTNPDAGGDVPIAASMRGLKNHVFWPKLWTARMLEFMKQHPLQ